jgi:plastocyanin
MKKLALVFVCALALASCGSDDKSLDPMDPGTPSASASATAAAKVVDVTIKGGKVTPQGDRVEVKTGQPVTLRVQSDEADEIHVHSEPEHSYPVEAGDAKEFTFTLETPGQIAVESHHLGVTIVQLVVRP